MCIFLSAGANLTFSRVPISFLNGPLLTPFCNTHLDCLTNLHLNQMCCRNGVVRRYHKTNNVSSRWQGVIEAEHSWRRRAASGGFCDSSDTNACSGSTDGNTRKFSQDKTRIKIGGLVPSN